MMRQAPRRHRTAALFTRLAALSGLFLLTACANLSLPGVPTLKEREDVSQLRLVPDNRAWITAPQGLLTLERSLGGEQEQIVALPNMTALRGDNRILLRARVGDGADRPRFQLDEFLERVGGAPEPFTGLNNADLRSREDALGTYFWSEKRVGSNTICVLGLRRATVEGRPLPRGTNALDMMLRNCVPGTVDDALAPIMAESVAYYPGSSVGPGPRISRSISPLAAPMP
jgi:hypothetical protein